MAKSQANEHILVWLPTPMGDAVLATPALRAMREQFQNSRITFLANPVVHDILQPSRLNDDWLVLKSGAPFKTAKLLGKYNFTRAVLMKNSFGSALAAALARIPSRVGYAREARGPLLTDKIYPPKLPNGRYLAHSMVDYYIRLARLAGADETASQHELELQIDPEHDRKLDKLLPQLAPDRQKPVIILVPGGAFGLNKCWPADRFAQLADKLVDKFNARVVISVAPNPCERQIAELLQQQADHELISIAGLDLPLGTLKALFNRADLVITNDTGPRHIAIALGKNVITLFGPNDPAWTDTGYRYETKIVGSAPCSPCQRPKCANKDHKNACINSIPVNAVWDKARPILAKTTG